MLIPVKQLDGTPYTKQESTSINYVIGANQNGLLLTVDTSGGDRDVTLPLISSVEKGYLVTIRKSSAAGGIVTILPSGIDTIAGPAPRTLDNIRQNATFISDGVGEWIIVTEFNQGITAAGSKFTDTVGVTNINAMGGPAGGIKSSVFLQLGDFPFKASDYEINGAAHTFEVIYLAFVDNGTTGEVRIFNISDNQVVNGSLMTITNTNLTLYSAFLNKADVPNTTDNILEIQARTTAGAGKVYFQFAGIRIINTVL